MLLFLMVTASATEPAEASPSLDCSRTVRAEQLAAMTGAASGAFAALDIEGFESHSERLWSQLGCVGDPLAPIDVADVFKVRALGAFLAQDDAGVAESMRAVRVAAPDFRIPASIAPKGHPLRDAFDAAAGGEAESTADLPVPSGARLLIDGQPVLALPTERAALVQLLEVDGAVSWTKIVEPGQELPAYEALSDDYRERYLQEAKVIRVKNRRPVELVVASSVGVVAASAMYGMSRASRATFLDTETPYEDLAGLRARTNGLQTASVLTGLAGVGLGAVAVVAW